MVLDKIKHQVTVDGEIINIPLKEYELLQLFAENPGIVFSRDTLLNRIWSTDYLGESRTVDVHISSLRNRLGQWGNGREAAIRAVHGAGIEVSEIVDVTPLPHNGCLTQGISYT